MLHPEPGIGTCIMKPWLQKEQRPPNGRGTKKSTQPTLATVPKLDRNNRYDPILAVEETTKRENGVFACRTKVHRI